MTVKCNKCGADIPDDASFCPGCGAVKPTQPQAPPQPRAQPQAPPQRQTYQTRPAQKMGGTSLEGFVDTIFSKIFVMLGFLVGILISWIGSLIIQHSAYDTIGNFLTTFGLLGAGVMMFGGGFLNTKLDKYIRLGLILIGGYIVITAIFTGTTIGLTNSLYSGLPF